MTLPTISKNKILLIALVVVAVIGFYLFKGKAPEPLATVEEGGPGGIGQELVVELNRLRALQNINTDIFKDPAYTSLQDFTQTVLVQPVGRVNPFAPVGSDL